MKKFKHLLLFVIVIASSIVSLVVLVINSEARTYSGVLSAASYEMADGSNYNFSDSNRVAFMSHKTKTAGELSISGEIIEQAYFRSVQGYGMNGSAAFKYKYTNQTLIENNADVWALSDSADTTVADIQLSNKIGYGVAIVQSSLNGIMWNTVSETNNLLSQAETTFYTPTEADLLQGTYYRIIIAYEIKHKTGEEGILFWKKDIFEYKECVEVSQFYMCYSNNTVVTKDIISGATLSDKAETTYGFTIDKSGSSNLVSVKQPDGNIIYASACQSFSKQGKYAITITTKLGKQYLSEVNVETGLSFVTANCDTYEPADNSGYNSSNSPKVINTSFGAHSYSELSIAVPYGDKTNKQDGKFGIQSSAVFLMFKLNSSALGSNWIISDDSWGKIENQLVNGITTGTVGKGAVILQKSTDGSNWALCDSGIYKNGVFTTDFQTNYGTDGYVCIYTPNGNEVLNGEYLRVTYAYEAYNESSSKYINVIEIYDLYICNDSLDAITFHNLSIDGKIDEIMANDDKSVIAIAKSSETMTNGSVTYTGFKIDNSLNPTVDITIKKDSKSYSIPQNNEIKENGKYEISLTSKLGAEKKLTLYVLNYSAEELYNAYFGESFITGKRIFSYGDYPVFEGGKTQYNIKKISGSFPVIWGQLKNLTTGSIVEINQNSNTQNETILNAGEYEAEFNTNLTFKTADPSGDNHKFKFKFTIIESGTAPGPVVNKQSLSDFSSSYNVTNYMPVYYGVTYQSAAKGNITLVFADKKSAVEFAYNYEKGMVEVQSDGSFRYTGTLLVSQKTKYESSWDLTDAINYFAEQAVQKLYFDLSDEFTYTTLPDDIIKSTDNLRTLELNHSIVVFANDEEAQKLLVNSSIPLINSKKYCYSIPKNLIADSGYVDFVFVKDENGYDSASVEIIDCNGDRYSIEYNKSVDEQLSNANCPSGIITIEEKTVYGDVTTYQAIYIANNENTSAVNLTFYVNDQKYTQQITSQTADTTIMCNRFSLSEIIDEFDPYGFVKITHNSTVTEYFSIIDFPQNNVFYEKGTYQITLTNRLGYYFNFCVTISDSCGIIEFSGYGADSLLPVFYTDETKILLPDLSRYGYSLIGYKTSSGSFFSNEITNIMSKGNYVLESVWEAKKFTLTLKLNDSVYEEMEVEFGQSYELPALLDTENASFMGWGNDKQNLLKNLTITEEGNIELTAFFSNSDINNETTADADITDNGNASDTTDGNIEQNPNKIWVVVLIIAILVVVIVAVVICFIIIRRKQK